MLGYKKLQQGVTLIELIIGIVVLAISLTLVTSVLGPLFIKSTDPWHQVRATELGQSLMNEILARSFDENSSRSGSLLRCNEAGALACTSQANFGPDGSETRLQFDDVDDFIAVNSLADALAYIDDAGEREKYYRNYQVSVAVRYATAADLSLSSGAAIGAEQLKVITLTVTTPNGEPIQFSALKGNW
ncbi:type IV pilus modification PilV family protein [Rheinheimera sp. WS51]|uniref:type IV pilus modification PilV family protein n=1 Tax=Rheinheimera sp. WS51 TaxID=3425886 RepID=UPI003D938119